MKSLFPTITFAIAISTLTLRADPMDEKQFQKLMKESGDIAKRMKPGIDGKDSAQVSKDGARIEEINKQMVAFWQAKKVEKAVKLSEESVASAKLVASSAKEQDWEKVKASLQGVMKNCKACHETYREKLDDGSYRFKL
ncbi:MAG: hypothetical protein EXS31_14755 [Pedosphaera sp.]|nr:hypothetical protein [Pedosphaera sp.]